MTTPLVTVIMAVCASDRLVYLKEAVASVQAQSHQVFECILVADGPLSNSLKRFVKSVCKKDNRFQLIALPENKGPATARNAAVAQAQGEFIAILDADDRAEPERLEQQLVFVGQSQADLVGSYYSLIDQKGRTIGRKQPPISFQRVRRNLVWMNPIGHSTVLGKAALFKEHSYPEGVRFGEDYALWIKLIREGYRLCNQPQELTQFRIQEDFSHRRRGWGCFVRDLNNRFHTLPLYPIWQRPFLALIAVGMSLYRLLPAKVLARLYQRWLKKYA